MKSKQVIGIIIVSVILLIFAGTALGGQSLIHTEISGVYRSIDVVVDGELVSMSEKPFIVQESGRTMVPVREIARAVDKPISWDASTSTIYIGSKRGFVPGKKDEASYEYLEDLTVLRNVGGFSHITSREVRVSRQPFEHVVAAELSASRSGEFVLELWGKYSRVEGFVGVADSTRNSSCGIKLVIAEGDDVKYETGVIRPAAAAKKFSVDIPNTRKLTFRIKTENVGIGEYPRVAAVLGNVKFYE